jgi:chemotaxis signal transduction protein
VSDLPRQTGDRVLTFEVGRALYALPLESVLEVVAPGRLVCVPMLPSELGGVMNHHGDALPVLSRATLFGVAERELLPARHILVIADGAGGAAAFGAPVDRVLGLTELGAGEADDPDDGPPSLDGREVAILDGAGLWKRAEEALAGTAGRPGPTPGGEQ